MLLLMSSLLKPKWNLPEPETDPKFRDVPDFWGVSVRQ